MKITKKTPLFDYPTIIGCVTLSNWEKIIVEHRATLFWYIQRWYYKDKTDTIERAIL